VIRKDAPRVESVHRALVLLKLIIEEGSLGVTEAAAVLDVNASTAQRLLATLMHDGFAAQGRDRRYSAGPALHSPGLATRIPQLTDHLRPALEALFERSGETVHLAALVGTRVLHLDGIEAHTHTLRFGLRVGVWLPAHLTAGGKALLADLSDEEVESRYALATAGARTQRPLVDLVSLRARLDEVRASRIAWNVDESEPGIAAMSISVGDFGGRRVAMSIALPSARFTPELGEKWSRDLIDIADAIADGRAAR
jgi:IclR family transcriptional regulator, acetate operon repressor